jgi:hypothetical protein
MNPRKKVWLTLLTFAIVAITIACSGANLSGPLNTGETAGNSTSTRTPVANNSGDNSVPTFADGDWTGGEAEVRVTGSDTRTITGTLSTESSTEGGTTRLIYTAGIDTISISISTEYQPFDIIASQEDFDVEIRFGQPPCEVTYQETSDKQIEGTFLCEYAEIMIGPTTGPAIMEGSFTATR